MPDYSDQLNQARAENQENSVKVKITGAIIDAMTKAIEDGKSWVWPVSFMIAGFNDLVDWGVLGVIPAIGDVIDGACVVILTGILWNIGGMIKWKIRIAVWIAGLAEIVLGIIIIPEFFPFWVVSIWYAHHRVKQRAELAEQGLKKLKNNIIDNNAVAEFK